MKRQLLFIPRADTSVPEGVIHRDLKLENVLVASQRRSYTNGPMLYNATG